MVYGRLGHDLLRIQNNIGAVVGKLIGRKEVNGAGDDICIRICLSDVLNCGQICILVG